MYCNMFNYNEIHNMYVLLAIQSCGLAGARVLTGLGAGDDVVELTLTHTHETFIF